MSITANFIHHPKKDGFKISKIYKDNIPLQLSWKGVATDYDLNYKSNLSLEEELKELIILELDSQGFVLSDEELEQIGTLIEISTMISKPKEIKNEIL